MADKITLTANDGSIVEFYNEIKAQGGVKDIYFSPDQSYVVAFYRKAINNNDKERLKNIVGIYRSKIFDTPEGDYWKSLFAWPDRMVEWEGKTGIVMPFYDKKFFFADGPFKGKEKEGKWFASARLRNKFLPQDQKGCWLDSMHMCIRIARGVRRLHAAGLAHSDLSYKNILVDPLTGSACIIDDDSLVVPGKFPPEVIGTPDFIAPEVIETKHLPLQNRNRKLPSRATDCHALAVLIYMYLLNRHPLRGSRVNDLNDSARDEELSMGKNALFIENPEDHSNRVKPDQLSASELPQGDPGRLPYTICGPYLKKLFDRAFIDGLHDPLKRPGALEWEEALVRTTDLLQPCQNPQCEAKWFVFDNTLRPVCPFCGHPYHGQLPVLNFYYAPSHCRFMSENYRLMVYNKQTLYKWHANRQISPNEKISAEDKKPVGDFHFFNNQWILINRRLPDMMDVREKKPIPIGGYVPLVDGAQILLDKGQGGRLIVVQLVSC